VDRTGSGSCPVAGFSTRSPRPSDSVTRALVNTEVTTVAPHVQFHYKWDRVAKGGT